MAIEFACHQCGGHFAAPDGLAGKQAKCKRCGAIVTVPIVLPAEQVIAVAPRAFQPAARSARQPLTVERPATRPVQQPAAMPFDLSAELPADLSPRTSTYTLPSAARRSEVPWTLIIVACVLVIVVSGVVGVGMTAAYLWPHFAQWMSDGEEDTPVAVAPPPAVTTPDPPPKPTVSPSLSNLPAPAPEQNIAKREEPAPALESGWGARPDPPLAPVTYKEGKLAISLPDNVQLLLPHGPSHFILGTVSDFRREAWQVFDLRTGKEIGKTIQQKLDINRRTAAFSPDGRYLAAVRDERESWGREVVVGVWSFATGEMTQALRLKGRALNGPLCFAAPHQLATLHDPDWNSSVLTVWNLQTGEKLRELPLPQGTFRDGLHPESLAVSPGGRYATIILGKQLGVIDLTTGEPAGAVTLPENPSSCEGVMFSPDGAELALLINGSAGHRLLLLDFATGRLLLDHDYRGRFPHFFYDGPPLDWLPDKSGLIFAGHLLLERTTGEEVWVFPKTDTNPRRFIRDGQILVLLDRGKGKVLHTADLPEKEIAKLMQSIRDGGAAVDAILPPLTTANLFSAAAGVLPTGPTPWSHQADAAGPMPRGLEREVLVAKGDETIRRVGFASPSSGKVVVQKEITPRGVVGRRQPRRVVLERYDLASGNKGATVEVPYVYQFADLSPSGKSAIVAFAEKGNNYERIDVLSLAPKKHVAAWRPYAGEREAEADDDKRPHRTPRLWGLPDSPRSVVWAALLDDDHVLTVNTAGKLICWRLPDCQAVYVFEEFGEPLALSAGRRYLAGNHLGEFRLFDAATGKCVGDLDPPKSGTRAVRGVFRPDGKELAAIIDTGSDKMLARWSLQDGKLLEETPLPPDAVGQYVPFHSSQRGARLGLEYRGPHHLMIDDEYLVDLPKRAVTWKYHVAGFYATNSPDHRTWYCTTKPNSPDRSLFLTAHDTPSSLVQQKAGAITLERQLVLQPGMSVRLHVDLSGAGVGEANAGAERAVHEALEFRDIVVEPSASLTFSVVAAERSTGKQIGVAKGPHFSPFSDPRDYKETFSQQELVVRMSVSDSTGKVLWHRDRAVSMPAMRVRGDMDASQQLREHMQRGFLSMLAPSGSATQSLPRYFFADLPTIIAGASTLGFHQEGPPPQVKLPENEKGPPGIAPGT